MDDMRDWRNSHIVSNNNAFVYISDKVCPPGLTTERPSCIIEHAFYVYALKGGDRMARKNLYNPGSRTPRSGQYRVVGSRGGDVGGKEVTSVKGHTLPPTPRAGLKYKLVDPTKHKS
jgi:hypothetical protein